MENGKRHGQCPPFFHFQFSIFHLPFRRVPDPSPPAAPESLVDAEHPPLHGAARHGVRVHGESPAPRRRAFRGSPGDFPERDHARVRAGEVRADPRSGQQGLRHHGHGGDAAIVQGSGRHGFPARLERPGESHGRRGRKPRGDEHADRRPAGSPLFLPDHRRCHMALPRRRAQPVDGDEFREIPRADRGRQAGAYPLQGRRGHGGGEGGSGRGR